MTAVVISQPMYFPWVGMFEQIRLADVYVNYGDVQFSKGSFTNRVQIKTASGMKWMTVPLQNFSLGQSIDEVKVSRSRDWRGQHFDMLKQAYAAAPFRQSMLSVVESVLSAPLDTLGAISRRSMEVCCDYYGLSVGKRMLDVADLKVAGASSQRVLDIVQSLGGSRYLTGLGARNYLDHALFEAAGIRVEYMDYRKIPYPQLHGEFTPFVSILDLIANKGERGIENIQSKTVYWKEYLNHE